MKTHHWPTVLIFLIATIFPATTVHALSPLQLLIDLTPEGTVFRPAPGHYHGSIVINKAIILDGQGKVTLNGNGDGCVVTIAADGVVVRNLRITGSGRSHDQVDSGVLIKADNVLVENNVIDNALFGVHISQGNHNIVRRNTISSLIDRAPTLRGEGVRLWYSTHNLIEENNIYMVRDMVLTNSPFNRIIGNRITYGRMGLELIFSPATEVAENIIRYNEHGIVGVYSDSLYIHHNRIEHQDKLSGSAIAVKGSSQTRIEYNEILDCAVGLTANSPTFPENILYIRGNKFAYNDVAMFFYGDKGGHIIHDNNFDGNFQQIAVTGHTSALSNDWSGNYWQDYVGFDLDGDGFGDKPYQVFLFSDRIWMDRAMTKFFRGSPALELIDFVERLAPFSEPVMIFEDPLPRIRR